MPRGRQHFHNFKSENMEHFKEGEVVRHGEDDPLSDGDMKIDGVHALAWGPRGDRIVVGMGSFANVFQITKDKILLKLIDKDIPRDGLVTQVAFSGDGCSIW